MKFDRLHSSLLSKTSSYPYLFWIVTCLSSDIFISFESVVYLSCFLLFAFTKYIFHRSLVNTIYFIERNIYFTLEISDLSRFGMMLFLCLGVAFTTNNTRSIICSLLLRLICSLNMTPLSIDITFTIIYCFINVKCSVLHFSRLPTIFTLNILLFLLDVTSGIFYIISIICIVILLMKLCFVCYVNFMFKPVCKEDDKHKEILAGDNHETIVTWNLPNFLQANDNFTINIKNTATNTIDPNFLYFEYNRKNLQLTIHYRITKPGKYILNISHNSIPSKLSIPISVSANSMSPKKSCVVIINRKKNSSPNQIYQVGKFVNIGILLKDSYDNTITFTNNREDSEIEHLNVSVSEMKETGMINIQQPNNNIVYPETSEGSLKGSDLFVVITFPVNIPNLHKVKINYKDVLLANGEFDIMVVTPKQMEKLNNNFSITLRTVLVRTKLSGFKEKAWKNENVYLFVTPSQIYLKKYFLRLIPIGKYVTWQLNNSIKIDIVKIDHHMVYLSIGNLYVTATIKLTLSDALYIFAGITKQINYRYKSGLFNKRTEYVKSELLKARKVNNLSANIDRDKFIHDSCSFLLKLTSKHEKIFVRYKNEYGIDEGGLTKEFFSEIQQALFVESNLFVPISTVIRKDSKIQPKLLDNDSTVRVMPNAMHNNEILKNSIAKKAGLSVEKLYFVCGILAARVIVDHLIYNMDHQLPITFCYSFAKQILDLQVLYYDFQYDDKEYFDSTIKYLENNDPSDLSLDFTDTIYGDNHKIFKEINLIPKGNDIEVTLENRQLYLNKISNHRLTELSKDNIKSFVDGFKSIIPEDLISIFNPLELCLLCCCKSDVDVEDMKANTSVSIFSNNSKEIIWFWKAVESLTQFEKKRLLQFITGSSSVPLNGFGKLVPQLKITKSYNPMDSLPITHTCFNRIDLPEYSSYSILQKNLSIAVNEGYKGFAFS